jgi:glycosyltransferase involved in cell wall biosynthesis
MKVAIILTTYNRPRALDRVLASLAEMRAQASEIVVADDGSGEATAQVVDGWKAKLPLMHVWHPDEGFRAAEIRNKAVLASSAEYLVFLDGDCMAPRDFVAQHQRFAEVGYMVAGNRMLLSEALTQTVEEKHLNPGVWGLRQWLGCKFRGSVNRLLPLLRLPDGSWRKRRPQRWQGVHTCNLGLWRRDFEAVNGFDQEFQGWGHEDADLAIRLMRFGIRRKEGACAVPVYHLWHCENDRSREAVNKARLMDVVAGKYPIRCDMGITSAVHGPRE